MRYFVITDIHANLEALDVCHADANRRGYDRVLVLGDIIGYGPDPNALIERVQALEPAAIVRGNHDKIAFGLDQAEAFNINARAAAQWTLAALAPVHREWLVRLPQGPVIVDDQVDGLVLVVFGGGEIDTGKAVTGGEVTGDVVAL